DSLDQELQKDVAAFCADGFADADFPRTLRDADEHDVHHADAADEQTDGGNAKHQEKNQKTDFVPEVEKIIRSEKREIIGLVAGKAALAAKEIANFLHGLRNLRRVAGLGKNHVVFLVRIEFAKRRDRHERDVVFRIRAAGNSLAAFLHGPDNGEKLTVDGDFFS